MQRYEKIKLIMIEHDLKTIKRDLELFHDVYADKPDRKNIKRALSDVGAALATLDAITKED
jgi:uncharacterized protein (UPF0147 family)